MIRGVARLMVGALAIFLAAAISAPVANREVDFTVVECRVLVTALIVEQLVGPDLRARRR